MTSTEAFDKAAIDVKTLTSRPSNDDLQSLYALYKQATVGDVTGKKPSRFDFLGRAKYTAWESKKHTTPEAARAQYVSLVSRLLSDAG
jgi:diazepam-binding inhibitor (GABA receptor modulating acyl-CoA-binding protein)